MKIKPKSHLGNPWFMYPVVSKLRFMNMIIKNRVSQCRIDSLKAFVDI